MHYIWLLAAATLFNRKNESPKKKILHYWLQLYSIFTHNYDQMYNNYHISSFTLIRSLHKTGGIIKQNVRGFKMDNWERKKRDVLLEH